MRQQIENDIRAFIAEYFLFEDNADSVAGAVSLIEQGIVTSTGVLELVSFLEERFALRVADDEIVPENFDTIDAIVGYVDGKTSIVRAG